MEKTKFPPLCAAKWNGHACDVLMEQVITTSENQPKKCFVIRIHGLELWKALRLVDAAEVQI